MDINNPVKDATSAAKQSVDRAADRLQDAANQSVASLGEVGDNIQKAIDRSLKDQPMTTLALAVAMGFVVGAIWKS